MTEVEIEATRGWLTLLMTSKMNGIFSAQKPRVWFYRWNAHARFGGDVAQLAQRL